MKKIILYIAASIDGRIAEADGNIEWLSEFSITKEMNYGYKEFIASIDHYLKFQKVFSWFLNRQTTNVKYIFACAKH